MRDASARIGLAPLVGLVYFSVCGGTYGIESAVGEGGAREAIVLVIALPLLWALPIALIVGELAALMPREGGYYAWAKAELGDFWACQTGWWALCYSVVDMALYPALFVRYLHSIVPTLPLDTPIGAWLAAALFIGAALALNLSGVRRVGRNAVLGAVLVIAPLLVCSVVVLWDRGFAMPEHSSVSVAGVAGGLSVVFWI
jgi:amino acid transporter